MEHSTDHEIRGLSRFISYLRGPKSQAFVAPYLRQIQKLESAAYEVGGLLNITSGFGVILDAIGRLVLCGRGELGDDDYKIALKVRIRTHRSKGRSVDFADVGEIATGGTWHVDDLPPACVRVWSSEPMPSEAAGPLLTDAFRRTRALGVSARHDYTLALEAEQFLMGWDTEDTEGDGHGLEWDDGEGYGGKLSHLEAC